MFYYFTILCALFGQLSYSYSTSFVTSEEETPTLTIGRFPSRSDGDITSSNDSTDSIEQQDDTHSASANADVTVGNITSSGDYADSIKQQDDTHSASANADVTVRELSTVEQQVQHQVQLREHRNDSCVMHGRSTYIYDQLQAAGSLVKARLAAGWIGEAINLLEFMADNGDLQASFTLGQAYFNGAVEGEKHDAWANSQRAVYHLGRCAHNGMKQAQSMLTNIAQLSSIRSVPCAGQQDAVRAVYPSSSIAVYRSLSSSALASSVVDAGELPEFEQDVRYVQCQALLQANRKDHCPAHGRPANLYEQLQAAKKMFNARMAENNIDKALELLEFMADNGDLQAAFSLGKDYKQDDAVTLRKAVHYLGRCAHNGMVEAQFLLGHIEYGQGKYNLAARLYNAAYQTNRHAGAANELALMCERQEGMLRYNKATVLKLYRHSSIQGWIPAVYNLADIYFSGSVGGSYNADVVDWRQAEKLYRKVLADDSPASTLGAKCRLAIILQNTSFASQDFDTEAALREVYPQEPLLVLRTAMGLEPSIYGSHNNRGAAVKLYRFLWNNYQDPMAKLRLDGLNGNANMSKRTSVALDKLLRRRKVIEACHYMAELYKDGTDTYLGQSDDLSTAWVVYVTKLQVE